MSLFEPISIKNVIIPNRVMKSAVWEGLTDESGKVTPKLLEIYQNLGQGGTGLITISATSVSSDGPLGPGQVSLYSDDHIDGIRSLVDAIHQNGAKAAIQLAHAGRFSVVRPVGPSNVEIEKAPACEELTHEEMKSILADFVAAAKRAEAAGVDLIQLHFAHGYLLNQFMSKAFNHRTDEYGGSLENRARFPIEVLTAVKEAVSCPIGIKLSAHDNLKVECNTIEDSVELVKLYKAAGCDFIEVSGGTGISPAKTLPIRKGKFKEETEAYHLDDAVEIKQAVGDDVVVAVVGGIRSVPGAARCLEAGVDMVSLGRPLISEPDLVNKKWKLDGDTMARCVNCSGCFRPIFAGEGIKCIHFDK
ncbi:hypothetical protein GEMRC1_002282 [Eukaryota sp. GEM-RC1]